MANSYSDSFLYKGTRIHFNVMGEGKPVVLLHGALLARPWAQFDDELAKHYQTFELILPGFDGNAAIRNDKHTIELYSEVLETFLKVNNLQHADFISFSLGAIVTAKTYLRMGLSGKMILIGIPQKLKTSILASFFYLIPVSIRRKLAQSKYLQAKVLFKGMTSNLNSQSKDDQQKAVERFIKNLSLTHPASIVDINYEKDINNAAQELIPQLINMKDKVKFVYGQFDTQSKKGLIKEFASIEKNSHSVFGTGAAKLLEITKDFLR